MGRPRSVVKQERHGDSANVQQCVRSLVALGFTPLEAEVYTFLVRESPATGYRVAQAMGKVPPNIYNALDALKQKGAILVDEGPSRLCRAVPYEELLSQLERRFDDCRREAASALARLPSAPSDERVYQLAARDQVYQRCRTMLRDCTRIALLDISPRPLEELRPELEAAAGRGVEVVIRTEGNLKVSAAEVVAAPSRASLDLDPWPGLWLNIVTDGREHLFAYLTPNGQEVHQATWSRSIYLSYVFHCSMLGEILIDSSLEKLESGASGPEIKEHLLSHIQRWTADTPGRTLLLERFDTQGPPRSP